MTDPVNHPAHYTDGFGGHEVIDIAEHLNFCRGSAIKYLARAGHKNGAAEIEDLRKAEWYIRREIKRIEALRRSEIKGEPGPQFVNYRTEWNPVESKGLE